MTRQDAIKELKIQFIGEYDRQREAKNIAIKALEEQPVLDKIRTEIEQIEINGYIRDVECFRAGIDAALNVINKYKVENER